MVRGEMRRKSGRYGEWKGEKEEWERWWEEGWGGGGAKSYDCEKAWSSVNHSILSALDGPPFCLSSHPPYILPPPPPPHCTPPPKSLSEDMKGWYTPPPGKQSLLSRTKSLQQQKYLQSFRMQPILIEAGLLFPCMEGQRVLKDL